MDRDRLRKRIGRNPIVRFGVKAMILGRTRGALRERPRQSLHYLFRGREVSNYTYELANVDQMVATLAEILEADREQISAYVRELHEDERLRAELSARLRPNPRRENSVRYGKRSMDYCIIRTLRPRVVAEIGTHDGLGTAVMLRALQRNAEENDEGRVLTFESSDEAGWLVPDDLRSRMTVYIGDAMETVEQAVQEHGVDFVNCDIGPYWYGKEQIFEMLRRHARGDLVIKTEIVDDTSVLPEMARRSGARYVSFQEQPEQHFWAGNQIGIAAFPHSD